MIEIVYRYNYTCNNCFEKNNVSSDYLLPGRDNENGNEEHLVFYVKCPHCGYIDNACSNDIPIQEKKELLKKYSGGLADIVFSEWILEFKKKKIEEKLNQLAYKKTLYKINSDQNRLFPNWKNNDELIEDLITNNKTK